MPRLTKIPRKCLDLIIPIYNEEDALTGFHTQLCGVVDALAYDLRIIYVNDGSSDRTSEKLEALAAADERVMVLELSRNFGHQAALTAGLDAANADYVITLDGDGEHPPALIPEMLRLAESGVEVVLTQRADAQQGSAFKHITSSLFYKLINWIGDTRIIPGSADFRLMDRKVVNAIKGMREYHRFLRGMVSWMGYRTVILPYLPPQRLAGTSKYSFKKMLKLAMDAVFSFSLTPMYIGMGVGVTFFLLALAEVIYVLSFWLTGNQSSLEPGWSSLMFMLLIVGGSLMIMLGVVGIYLAYIFQQVKLRPIYLVRRVLNPRDTPSSQE